MMRSEHCLSDDVEDGLGGVLAEFVDRSWERDVGMLPAATRAPFVPQSDILAALAATAGLEEDPPVSDYVVWIGGELQAEPRRFAARASDRSLSAYLERIAAIAGGCEFTVLVSNPHRVNQRLRERVARFARMLADSAGVPCGGFDTGIFLGCYGRTPFGVHRGQMSVLTFPILGNKRFLLWPRRYGESHRDIQDSLEYERHRPTALELCIGPGDIGYWPADYWHVADGPVAMSAALNIGMWWDRPPLDVALQGFAEVLARHHDAMEADRVTVDLLRQGRALPPEFDRALELIAEVARLPETRAALELELLAKRSAGGMRDPYPIRHIQPPPGATRFTARLMAGERIAVEPLADGSLGVALLGAAIAIPPLPDLVAMLATLNDGGAAEFDLPALAGEDDPVDPHSRLAQLLAQSAAVEATPLPPGSSA